MLRGQYTCIYICTSSILHAYSMMAIFKVNNSNIILLSKISGCLFCVINLIELVCNWCGMRDYLFSFIKKLLAIGV